MGHSALGVSRLIGALVEASHDKEGIVWPAVIAPYQILILPVAAPSPDPPAPSPITLSMALYDSLSASPSFARDVLIDDRIEQQTSQRIKHGQLMGIPWTILVTPSAVEDSHVEVEARRTGEKLGYTSSPCIVVDPGRR